MSDTENPTGDTAPKEDPAQSESTAKVNTFRFDYKIPVKAPELPKVQEPTVAEASKINVTLNERQSQRPTNNGLPALSEELRATLKKYTAREQNHETPTPYELRVDQGADNNQQHTISREEIEPEFTPREIGFFAASDPEQLFNDLSTVGYRGTRYLATQVALMISTASKSLRALMLEGDPGAGKTFLAQSLAKITGAEFIVAACYQDMNPKVLLETAPPIGEGEKTRHVLGPLSRAFQLSHAKPVILLIDEIDKADARTDTFFLGALNDCMLTLESTQEVIQANRENLLVIFTKNYNRNLDDALLRRVTPIKITYMDLESQKKILEPYCFPQIVANLVFLADLMRKADGVYRYERAPAPDEVLRSARYVVQLLEWNPAPDFAFVGQILFTLLAKSDRDRNIFESMLRFHPEFGDALIPDPRKATLEQIYAKLGRVILKGVIADPQAAEREKRYQVDRVGFQYAGKPDELVRKLELVGYECLPYLAVQLSLVLDTPREMVKTLVLEGPPGCGKSFMAKALSRVTGAELLVFQCYKGMPTNMLIEYRNEVAIARAGAGLKVREDDIMELGVLSRAFLKSQSQPVILLIDEIDKVDVSLDTFFLGPIQDGRIWSQAGRAIDANLENLLLVFTKNFERPLNDALLRRVHPIQMTYLDSKLERKILKPHCVPQLIDNLVGLADIMRYSQSSYQYDRPPAPEELLTCGRYISRMIEWGVADFSQIGGNIWAMICKSERDRAVLEHMLRHHPDFMDPLLPDARHAHVSEIYARLGRYLLKGLVADPFEEKRKDAWKNFEYN